MIQIIGNGEDVKQLRSEPRMKVLLTGELSSRRGLVACRIVDISRGGACLDADRPHQIGEDISFRRGTLHAKGQVVWSRGKRFGISFDDPIRATELLVQMSHSRAATQTVQPVPRLSAAPRPFS